MAYVLSLKPGDVVDCITVDGKEISIKLLKREGNRIGVAFVDDQKRFAIRKRKSDESRQPLHPANRNFNNSTRNKRSATNVKEPTHNANS